MVDVEVFGQALIGDRLTIAEIRRLCELATAAAGVSDGHLAIEFVDPRRMARLNAEHRGRPEPTDVLSFPIDGAGASARPTSPVPHELGDVLICPEHARDLREVVVHGVLHLVGMDHETDEGEMLELQATLLHEDGSAA